MGLSSSGSGAAAKNQEVASSNSDRAGFQEIGIVLLIGFATPLIIGIVRNATIKLFATPGIGFAIIWLLAMLLISAATLYITIWRERMPLSSIGVDWPNSDDLWLGGALFGGVLIIGTFTWLVGLTPESGNGFQQLISAANVGAYQVVRTVPLWMGLSIATAAAVAEELVARGYAIRGLQVLTGSVVVAALVSLGLDLFCYAALVTTRAPAIMWIAPISLRRST